MIQAGPFDESHHARSNDFLTRLMVVQPGLPAKMARLAAFVSENYVQAAFMSTRELATAAGVSVGTVVRFPAALGYPDFEALRASIRTRINEDLQGIERLRSLPHTGGTPTARLHRIIQADIDSLERLAQTFSEPQFDHFVSVLQQAQAVTVVGFRYISPLASHFGYALGKIRTQVVTFVEADSKIYDHLRLAQADHVLVVIAFVPYTADSIALVRYAHSLHQQVLVIVDSLLAPVLPYADVGLLVKPSMLDFVGSLAAPAALLNGIVTELGLRLGDESRERLRALAELAEQRGLYADIGKLWHSPRLPDPPVHERADTRSDRGDGGV